MQAPFAPFAGSMMPGLSPSSTTGSVSSDSNQGESNMFLKNLDRTMLTFNMHNIAEVCFNHVFKRKALQESPNKQLT